MNLIGKHLKTKGRKQKWLAEQLGLSENTISSYVNNNKQPKIETLLKISKILEVELTDLIESNDI